MKPRKRRPGKKTLLLGGVAAAAAAALLLKRDKVAALLPGRSDEPAPAEPAYTPPPVSNYDAAGPVANTATAVPVPARLRGADDRRGRRGGRRRGRGRQHRRHGLRLRRARRRARHRRGGAAGRGRRGRGRGPGAGRARARRRRRGQRGRRTVAPRRPRSRRRSTQPPTRSRASRSSRPAPADDARVADLVRPLDRSNSRVRRDASSGAGDRTRRAEVNPRLARIGHNRSEFSMSTLVGMQLSGRYRLDAQIGAGGMSTVYRAFDVNLERRVAIKLLHREMSADSDQLERFRREARAVAQLSHPHIVGVIDAGEDENRPVHRLRVRRGRDAQGPHPPARPAAGRRGAGLRDRDRPRARLRARARDRAPRRQAPERPARPRGLGQGHRLRHRPLAARRRPDRRRPRARHDRLRLARAGARPRRRRPVRHLLARHRPLRDAHGRRPVPRREPDLRGDEARPRGPAGHPAHPPRGARPPPPRCWTG